MPHRFPLWLLCAILMLRRVAHATPEPFRFRSSLVFDESERSLAEDLLINGQMERNTSLSI